MPVARNQQERIRQLWDLGHFFNPTCPKANGVTEADLPKLTLKDEAVQQAVFSWQEFMAADLEPRVWAAHRRPLIVDGDMGPATADQMDAPRCGHPDYGTLDEKGHLVRPGTGEYRDVKEARESNWPKTCRNELHRTFRGSLKKSGEYELLDAFKRAVQNWNRAIDVTIRASLEYGKGHINSRVERMRGSTLAYSHLARNSCSAKLDQAYNTNVTWSWALLVTTITHEDGHALGFQHNRDGSATMYPNINQAAQQRLGFPNDTDMRVAVSNGYRDTRNEEPDEPDQPDDPNVPDGGRLVLEGSLRAMLDGKDLGQFIVVPKPRV